MRAETIWAVCERERPSLVAYRGPFDGFHAVAASVSKTCLVRFDGNWYSVTGKSHLAIAIARACIRAAARGRFFNVVDLVNRLETEARGAPQGRLADHLTRLDFVVLDELGYLPFAQTGAQLPTA